MQEEKKIESDFVFTPTSNNLSIEIYQQDWIPGFAAFLDDGSVKKGKAHVCLNVGSLMAAVQAKDVGKNELPYLIAESLMHEIIHAFEAWAGVEFNEDKVEALLEKYRIAYGKGVATLKEEPLLTVDNLSHCPCGSGAPVLKTYQELFGDDIRNVQEKTIYNLICPKCGREVNDEFQQKCFQKWNDKCLTSQNVCDLELDHFHDLGDFDDLSDSLEGQI